MENFYKDKFKLIVLFALLYIAFPLQKCYSQTFSESDIKKLAEQVNRQIKGVDFGDGIKAKGCLSIGRTLFYQYEVPDYWEAPHNIKKEIISNFITLGVAKSYYLKNIDVDCIYYKGNSIAKKVSIKSNEFSTYNLATGEYISIENHPKAKGVNLKIQPPSTWEVKEGNRPNIVKKFVYKNNSYMILVQDNDAFYSRNEAKELLNDKNFTDEVILASTSFLKNPVILNQSIVTIDRYPALVYTYKGSSERSGINVEQITKCWAIFYEDKYVFLICDSKTYNEFKTFESLYNLITNSVIFPDQYNY